MAVSKFVPDRQPRRGDQNNAMTVWAVLLNLIDWLTSNYVGQFKSGSATIPNTATTVVVNHGLGLAAHRVSLVPLLDPGGRYWVSGKTSTQFQINLTVAAPVGGIPFDWMVKGD